MSRAFAYLRVSTSGQTTDNQLQEIRAAGFSIEPRRVVTETVSGSLATARRRGFARLLDRLEPGDVLVVTKLDRLGRDATDVGSTVAQLAGIGVRVHCLALGGVDLASSTGKLTMGVINAVAEFERDLLVERTQAGLSRAKAEGKRLGRPASLTAGAAPECAAAAGGGGGRVRGGARVRDQPADHPACPGRDAGLVGPVPAIASRATDVRHIALKKPRHLSLKVTGVARSRARRSRSATPACGTPGGAAGRRGGAPPDLRRGTWPARRAGGPRGWSSRRRCWA